ncbi:hypothetical protein S7711_06056 [Stachybotrys chartarum IBT 7711]|uniref:Uncharacterized protein n=1 Tax=Stachybotrys chartarum (strain CBS 109288 / IBT 7711) TaxID=1280523 RepID=A0A084B216_STACB|nr:hypothetical protein S7711_06056 [Stachybotrys chartarum IBT 7711]KFA54815.1 hypothetical protein S40293_00768 [Stachybotrys chartarum IBT 40293]
MSDATSDTVVVDAELDAPEATYPLADAIRFNIEGAIRDMCAIATSPSTSALSSGSISSFVDVKFPEQPEDVKPIVNPTDFINGIGDYLLRVAVLQSHLTERLIKDPQINRFIVEAHQQSHKKTDTADLSSIVAFDIQLGRLCKIRDLASKFSRDVQEVWNPRELELSEAPILNSPFSPLFHPNVRSQTLSLKEEEESSPSTRKVLPDSARAEFTTPPERSPTTDDSEDDDEQFQAIDLEALRHRGIGKYNCPKGRRCDKGGVDQNGDPIDFKRNSAFM